MSIKSIQQGINLVQLRPSAALTGSFVLGAMIHLLLVLFIWQDPIPALVELGQYKATLVLISPFLASYILLSLNHKRIGNSSVASKLYFLDNSSDIMMGVNLSGEITYMNLVAKDYCIQESEKKPNELLLPASITNIMQSFNSGNTKRLGLEHQIGDRLFEYTINASPEHGELFITGRDISERRSIENNLLENQRLLRDMSDLVDDVCQRYDPLNFDLQKSLSQLVETILTRKTIPHTKNTHKILIVEYDESSTSGAYLFQHDDSVVTCLKVKLSREDVQYLSQQKVSSDSSQNSTTQNIDRIPIARLLGLNNSTEHKQNNRLSIFTSGKIVVAAVFEAQKNISEFDTMLHKTLATYANLLFHLSNESSATDEAFMCAVEILARVSEINNIDTGSHIHRINEYSRVLATQMGLPQEFISQLSYSAQMHDIGQLLVPTEILKKQGSLDSQERQVMQNHSLAGAHILGNSPRLKMAADIAKHHHERFDGSGYPQGLKGDDIPLSARIVAVADVYDALRQQKSYKDAISHNEAIHFLTQGDGDTSPDQFDPRVLEALVKVQDKFDEIFSRFRD